MEKFNIKSGYEPNSFLDLKPSNGGSDFDSAEAVIVPYGYEGTVTFGHGTDQGPKKLIESSWQVETFDDELFDDIQNQIKIWTTKEPAMPKDPMQACEQLSAIVTNIIDEQKLPVVIGGEHTISYGFAQALSKKYTGISVLVFDAHMDLGDRSSGKDFTHAAWLKYSMALPNFKSATLLGIRNFNKIEHEYCVANPEKINIFLARDKKNWDVNKILNSLTDNVYLSFDIDAFDSAAMPATGTPEPDGLWWDEVMPILKRVLATKNIIGMDLVELAPIKGFHAPDFLAAKLLMKMLLYKFKGKELLK